MADNDEEGLEQGDLLGHMKRMDNYSEYALLKRLKKTQIKELLAKVELGIASHQEHAIIARIISDNGLILPDGAPGDTGERDERAHDAPHPKKQPPKVEDTLPSFGDDEDFT